MEMKGWKGILTLGEGSPATFWVAPADDRRTFFLSVFAFFISLVFFSLGCD